jgi:hypothetical protein
MDIARIQSVREKEVRPHRARAVIRGRCTHVKMFSRVAKDLFRGIARESQCIRVATSKKRQLQSARQTT